MAHGDAHAAPVQRVGAAGPDEHRVDAQRRGVAEEGAEVLVIVDALEDQHPARGGEQVGRVDAGGPVGAGEDAAVEMEPDDARHRVGVGDVGREVGGRTGAEVVGEVGHPTGDAEDGARRVARGEQAPDHDGALGEDETAATGTVRATVGAGEIPEVGESRIGGIDLRPEIHHASHALMVPDHLSPSGRCVGDYGPGDPASRAPGRHDRGGTTVRGRVTRGHGRRDV